MVNCELPRELDGAVSWHDVRWTLAPRHGAEQPDQNRADSLARGLLWAARSDEAHYSNFRF